MKGAPGDRHHLVTEFSKEMFNPRTSYAERTKLGHSSILGSVKEEPGHEYTVQSAYQSDVKSEITFDFDLLKQELNSGEDNDYTSGSEMSRETIRARLDVLEKELADLRNRRQQQELEIANIENQALRQRFQDILDNLLTEMLEKEQEYQELTALMPMQ